MIAVVNELANTLGNLQLRCTSTKINPSKSAPKLTDIDISETETALINSIENILENVERHYNAACFGRGLDDVLNLLHDTNKYFDSQTPWLLAKAVRHNPEDLESAVRLATVIYMALESIRVSAILLQPISPDIAAELLNRLRVPSAERGIESLRFGLTDGGDLTSDTAPLIQRLEYTEKRGGASPESG